MTTPCGENISASQRAYTVIRGSILDGTLAPGTTLGEESLAGDLGVSRTPVRVALARLQDEGWIVIYPQRGALIQGVSEATVVELAGARFVLETTSVDRAPIQERHRLAERLELSIAGQRDALTNKGIRSFIDLTLHFHRGFVEASGNTVLLELYDQLSDRHRFVLFAAGARLLTRCQDIIAEHVTLVEHLRAGNSAVFAEILRGHIAENSPPSPS